MSVDEYEASMSVDEYYAAVGRLDLKPSAVPHVYVRLSDGEHFNVPDATRYSPEDRASIIEKLKARVKGY